MKIKIILFLSLIIISAIILSLKIRFNKNVKENGNITENINKDSIHEFKWETKDYKKLIEEYGDDGLFPKNLPSNATNIYISCKPFYTFQCGAHKQLQMNLPNIEIQKLYNKYTHKAKYISDSQHYEVKRNKSPSVFYGTTRYCGTQDGKFPESFRFFILERTRNSSKGVAISTSIARIVYWFDHWP